MDDRAIEYEASYEEVGERRARDRRAGERRRAPRGFDPLFAATLVNHVAPPERAQALRYPQNERLRAGVVVNLRA